MRKILLGAICYLTTCNVSSMNTESLYDRLIEQRNSIIFLTDFCNGEKPCEFEGEDRFLSCFPNNLIVTSKLKNFRNLQKEIDCSPGFTVHANNEFIKFIVKIYALMVMGVNERLLTNNGFRKIEEWYNEASYTIKQVCCKLFNSPGHKDLFIQLKPTDKYPLFFNDKGITSVKIINKIKNKRSINILRTNDVDLKKNFDALKACIESIQREDVQANDMISLLDKNILCTISLDTEIRFDPVYSCIFLNAKSPDIIRYSPLPLNSVQADSTGWYPFSLKLGIKPILLHELGHVVYNSILTMLCNAGDDTYESILNSTLNVAEQFLEDGACFDIPRELKRYIKKIKNISTLEINTEKVPVGSVVSFLEARRTNKAYIMRLLFDGKLEEIFQILGFIVIKNELIINPHSDIVTSVRDGLPICLDHGLMPLSGLKISLGNEGFFRKFFKECPKSFFRFSGLKLNEPFMKAYFEILGLNYEQYIKRLANFRTK